MWSLCFIYDFVILTLIVLSLLLLDVYSIIKIIYSSLASDVMPTNEKNLNFRWQLKHQNVENLAIVFVNIFEIRCCFVMRCNKFICRCPLRRIPFSTFCLFCQYQFTLNVYLYSLQGYSVNGNCVIINITSFAVTKGNNNSFLVQH